jgi:hypothetical protein
MHHPLFGDQHILVTIRCTPIVGWQLIGVGACAIILERKKIIPHFTSWVIEEFQLLSNGGGMLDGNLIFSVTT